LEYFDNELIINNQMNEITDKQNKNHENKLKIDVIDANNNEIIKFRDLTKNITNKYKDENEKSKNYLYHCIIKNSNNDKFEKLPKKRKLPNEFVDIINPNENVFISRKKLCTELNLIKRN
jgi:hypothetical protein